MRNMLVLSALALASIGIYLLADGGSGRVRGNDQAAPPFAADSVIVFRDKLFFTQLQDMAMNADSYAGKTVRMEGFTLLLEEGLPWRFAVARIFSCCGPDGFPVGLPCAHSGETPKKDAWIEVEGIFRVDETNNPYLEVITLTVKDKPGKRNVGS